MQKKLLKFAILPIVIAFAWVFLSFSPRSKSDTTEDLADVSITPIEELTLDGSELFYTVDSVQMNLPLLQKDYFGFKEAVGNSESRGLYNLVNKFGYMGKYQFGKSALASIGVYDITGFVQDPAFQEEAFYAFTARNKWYIRDLINQYEGKVIQGILITESGILAATHLAGPGGVRRFLKSNGLESKTDAFGTQVKHYMKAFGGYDLSAVEADKNPKVKRANSPIAKS